MKEQLPSVFIGSSVEGLDIAREVELQLQHVALTTIWKDGVFGLGSGTLEALLDIVHQFDFAVMILSPDDLVESRNARLASPRDNVIFELGLFMGRLGRKRSFIVHEQDANLKLPSDLAGITLAPYRKRENLSAALSPTCTPIIKAIRSRGFFTSPVTTTTPQVKVSNNATKVLTALAAAVRGTGPNAAYFPFVSTAPDRCKLSRNVVEQSLAELQSLGLIHHEEKVGRDLLDDHQPEYPVLSITDTGWDVVKDALTDDVGHVGEAVFDWMDLSPGARQKLARSQFIKIGGTRHALMTLVNSAGKNDSILAICGYKGDYSSVYYEENFKTCKAVSRVFSYQAILSEIKEKKVSHALGGLKMHLDEKATGGCDVEVILIPKGKAIRDLGDCNFDPPLSFGLTILRDENNSAKKAVAHWEMDARLLRDLIAIEGVIIDDGQEDVLLELVNLWEAIAGSDHVLSHKTSKTSEIMKNRITALCTELEEIAVEFGCPVRESKI